MALAGGRRSLAELARAAAAGFGRAGTAAVAAEQEIAPFGARHASQLAVKNRMKSVTNIQKITKAMKMVAASKLRNAQNKVEESRGVFKPIIRLLGDEPGVDVKRNLTIAVTSDKGLCGGINSTVVKYSRGTHNLLSTDPEKEDHIVVIGEKGKVQLQRVLAPALAMSAGDVQKVAITFSLASEIADEILKTTPYDAARIIFNRFVNSVTFTPAMTTVLSAEEIARDARDNEELNAYQFVGVTQDAFLTDIAEFQLASTLLNGMLENACSEHGARMSAMDNSTRNASDMLERLTLDYNRSRQARITTELIEIISGASAIEG
eukprot:jgi/Chlat1/2044/Chrsp17S02522